MYVELLKLKVCIALYFSKKPPPYMYLPHSFFHFPHHLYVNTHGLGYCISMHTPNVYMCVRGYSTQGKLRVCVFVCVICVRGGIERSHMLLMCRMDASLNCNFFLILTVWNSWKVDKVPASLMMVNFPVVVWGGRKWIDL